MLKDVIGFTKYKIKQLFCKHSYFQKCKFYGHHIDSNKEVIFGYEFECMKCGKRKYINMDEDYQLKGEK